MFMDTVDNFAKVAEAKAKALRERPAAFWVSAMMAGAYVGLGIILIFCLGAPVDPSVRGVVMGASFAVALTLVIFAGSDLFTGHTMFMTIGWLRGTTTLRDLAASWSMTWLGNLAGCAVLAALFVSGGGGAALGAPSHLLVTVAAAKMNAPALELFARAILCNWLVCLAIWMAARMTNDTAKCLGIFWCLYAFIGSGFEHSIANMTLLLIALFAEHPATVTYGGLVHNLIWVTLGNIVSGAGFMGVGYWFASGGAGAEPRRALGTAPAE
ncbi:MAG TPA: nitrite transporter NirC [Candidatus Sulfotelmatobacter sp.]|nr:nitrite transporter NirC [Candidatus Sulfotelmatobacter sp.]